MARTEQRGWMKSQFLALILISAEDVLHLVHRTSMHSTCLCILFVLLFYFWLQIVVFVFRITLL